jgi:hypothetical protein
MPEVDPVTVRRGWRNVMTSAENGTGLITPVVHGVERRHPSGATGSDSRVAHRHAAVGR